MSSRGRRSAVNWDDSRIDWQGMTDAQIGRLPFVEKSRQRVGQIRSKREKGGSLAWHACTLSASHKIKDMDASRLTPSQVARRVGCKASYARSMLVRHGKEFVQPPDRRYGPRFNWGMYTDEEYRTLPNKELAEGIGVASPAVVATWMKRRGLAKSRSRTKAKETH